MKSFILGVGTILALFCAFLLAGFLSAVFFATVRLTTMIIAWFRHPVYPKKDTLQTDSDKSVEEFMVSQSVFVRNPLDYKDKNHNNIDDLDETR